MSGDTPQTYQYEPLTANGQIRIVTLLPGNLHDPIKVIISSAYLKNCENSYTALSYAWGDHSNKVAITVVEEGDPQSTKIFQVTRSLSMALRHLRDIENRERLERDEKVEEGKLLKNENTGEDEEITAEDMTSEKGMTLWIDALCINQADNREKSTQVSMMTDIYAMAHGVKIWLGPAADDSDRAMEALRNGHLDLMRPDLVRFRRAVEALARREFWTRVWVVQEIFVGKNPTIVCGQSEADWKSSAEVIHRFLICLKNTLGETSLPNPTAKRDQYYEASRREISQRTQRADKRPIQAIEHLAKYRVTEPTERGRSWLLDMLLNLRHLGATDPRDKVFSLLGLLYRADSKDLGPLIRPRLDADYGLSFLEVSIKLAKYYVLGPIEDEKLLRPSQVYHKALNILCASQPDTSSNFPTWLPDFSKDNGMERWPLQVMKDGFSAEPSFSDDNLTLSVHAQKLATVQTVTGSEDDCLASDSLSLLARLNCFIELLSKSSLKDDKLFWQTLVLGDGTGKKETFAGTFSPNKVLKWIEEALERHLQKEAHVHKEEIEGAGNRGMPRWTNPKDASNRRVSRWIEPKDAGDREPPPWVQLEGAGNREAPSWLQPKGAEEEDLTDSVLRAFFTKFSWKSYRRRFAVFESEVYTGETPVPDKDAQHKQDAKKVIMAMVPEGTKRGDRLYQLGNCDYLVVLRPIIPGIPCFNFVGPCWLPDLSFEKGNKTKIAIR